MKMTKDKKVSVGEAISSFNDIEEVRDNRYIYIKYSFKDIENNMNGVCGSYMNPHLMYLKMRCMIIREGWKDHKNYPLKKRFYDNGYLVMSMSTRQMAEEFNMNRNRITEFINKMKEAGWIKVMKLAIPGKPKPQNVYVFGTWDQLTDRIEEYYYFG